ncbi:MAG: shikimate kinase [Flavobacteriales bacterium]|nr:shikimate kinase [Flavobacteriales bacterium]|tara:strand:- start:14286 stop:14804 length:519 start_codon:yes stop_codon:yes gene_type:complete
MSIFLIGYMGSGKSILGKQASIDLQRPFWDLDDMIQEKLNLSIFEIFNQKGEDFFRKIEHEILIKHNFESDAIIATGGGTPCFFDNHNFMKSIGHTIYLKVSSDELCKRLQNIDNRPLLFNNKLNLNQFIQDNLSYRDNSYSESNFTLESDNILAEELSDLIRKIKYEENTD